MQMYTNIQIRFRAVRKSNILGLKFLFLLSYILFVNKYFSVPMSDLSQRFLCSERSFQNISLVCPICFSS